MERRTIRKWFWVWDFEKEDQWLNLMAQQGWLLDGVGFATYHFVSCEPGAYTVRLEMREHDDNYLDFMAQTGAEYIGRMAMWIYFRKEVSHGPFDIFSDMDSKIAHLNRIDKTLFCLGMANLVLGLANSFNSVIDLGWVSLLAASLMMYGLGRIRGKKEELVNERRLRE